MRGLTVRSHRSRLSGECLLQTMIRLGILQNDMALRLWAVLSIALAQMLLPLPRKWLISSIESNYLKRRPYSWILADNPTLAQQIAAETGVKVVTDLHLEFLTEGAPAGTYIDMMRYNVTKIVEALK